jgi:hypothetical protein
MPILSLIIGSAPTSARTVLHYTFLDPAARQLAFQSYRQSSSSDMTHVAVLDQLRGARELAAGAFLARPA